MKYLFLITRTDNVDYDEYDSAVVCAGNAEHARRIHPSSGDTFPDGDDWKSRFNPWVSNPEQVKVEYLGVAPENITVGRVICASFNAG
jgi:hypothetical protein